MVSVRRAARAGLDRPAGADDEVPEWIWSFQMNRYFMRRRAAGEEATIEGFIAARKKWHEDRDAWLAERGLVVWGMGGLFAAEYRRIEREEPHRVLRRPER